MGKENKKNNSDDGNNEEYYKKYNGLWGESLSRLKNRLVYNRKSDGMVCIYCGEHADTREHCPPMSFFPDNDCPPNLRVLPACYTCNNGYSDDEELIKKYLNCIYDKYHGGNIEYKYSKKIREYVNTTEHMRRAIKEADRVFSKVAQGLAIYEMSDCFGDYGWLPEMTKFICKPWIGLKEWENLKSPIVIESVPELGSRSFDGIAIVQVLNLKGQVVSSLSLTDWTDIKASVFSYLTWSEGKYIKVRMILRDFFFVEVVFHTADK